MTDAAWEDLLIPINLAFFFRSSATGRVVAAYPSPAGATESLLTLEAWQQLEEQNPILKELEPDVEALLVNRVGQAREIFRVPIDECYKLVGIIRANWRGLSGGSEVWTAIEAFRADLKARGSGAGGHTPSRKRKFWCCAVSRTPRRGGTSQPRATPWDHGNSRGIRALKGRHTWDVVSPFQGECGGKAVGFVYGTTMTQGVALG